MSGFNTYTQIILVKNRKWSYVGVVVVTVGIQVSWDSPRGPCSPADPRTPTGMGSLLPEPHGFPC